MIREVERLMHDGALLRVNLGFKSDLGACRVMGSLLVTECLEYENEDSKLILCSSAVPFFLETSWGFCGALYTVGGFSFDTFNSETRRTEAGVETRRAAKT